MLIVIDVEGRYELSVTLKSNSDCLQLDNLKITETFEIQGLNNGLGVKCGWNGKTLGMVL